MSEIEDRVTVAFTGDLSDMHDVRLRLRDGWHAHWYPVVLAVVREIGQETGSCLRELLPAIEKATREDTRCRFDWLSTGQARAVLASMERAGLIVREPARGNRVRYAEAQKGENDMTRESAVGGAPC